MCAVARCEWRLQVTGVLNSSALQEALPKLASASATLLSSPPYEDEQPWERLEAFDALLDGWVRHRGLGRG